MLDAEENLQLALHASSAREHHACIAYLREALQQEPRNGKALYLLAVQHAELGLLDRAIDGMHAALAFEPSLEVARFQLGLLLLDRRRPAEAKQQFAKLDQSSDAALRMCCEALIALADNAVLVAQEKLAVALSLKSANSALHALIQRLLEKLAGEGASRPLEPREQIRFGAYQTEVS
jgi:tetratricopeptide (TPR) repeat protein